MEIEESILEPQTEQLDIPVLSGSFIYLEINNRRTKDILKHERRKKTYF